MIRLHTDGPSDCFQKTIKTECFKRADHPLTDEPNAARNDQFLTNAAASSKIEREL